MAEATLPATEIPSVVSPRAASRQRAVRRFKLMLLSPLIAMFVLVLTPVLLLQLYFSFHQWTVYLGSWWDAEYVGFDMFHDGVHRSALRLGGRALAVVCHRLDRRLLRVRLRPRLSHVQAVPRQRRLLHHLHPADADRAGGGLLHRRDDALSQRAAERRRSPPSPASISRSPGSPIRISRWSRWRCSRFGIGRRSPSSSC